MTAPTRRIVRRDQLVGRHEAAEILGVHPNTIDRLGKGTPEMPAVLRRYRIRGVRGVLYDREEVEACIVEIPAAQP